MTIEATSRSRMAQVRGRRYHVRSWGDEHGEPVFLLHGAMDISASFEFLARYLSPGRHYLAPDWCGSGESEPASAHWYPDYVADLDVLLEQLSPGRAVNLVGHSRGGNVAGIYAGARPHRVNRLVTVEGIGYSAVPAGAGDAVKDLCAWLDQQRSPRPAKLYDTVEDLAQTLQKNNPGLTRERAGFLARQWARGAEGGRLRLATVHVPREKEGVPVPFETYQRFWSRITAPVLYVSGGQSHISRHFSENPGEFARRASSFPDFQTAEIGGAGHMVHFDEPEALAGLIDRFLSGDAGPAKRKAQPAGCADKVTQWETR